MKNINLFNRKGLKSFRSSLRNRSTSVEAALWNILKSRNQINHPGRYKSLQYIDYYSTPATSPSKATLYTHFPENNTFDNLFGSGRSLILPQIGFHLNNLFLCVEEFGMTAGLREDKGEGSSGDSTEC